MLNARKDRDVSVVPAALASSDVIAVVAVCQRGTIRAVNRAFSRRLAHESSQGLVGKSLRDELLVQRADWATWKRTAATGEAHDVRFECTAADGSTVLFRGTIERVSSGRDLLVRAVLFDDTATHRLQELSMRMAGIEAMSALTAGVSHDFKNLLTVLVGNLYLVSELVEEGSPAHDKVRRARDMAKRGAELAKQLLDLAIGRDKASASAAATTHPRDAVAKLLPLLSAAVGERIELRTEFSGDIPSLAVSRAHFESVITNLVINARDSFGPEGGTVVVSVTPVEVGTTLAASLNLEPGLYVETKIQDSGSGIPQELIDKVFEPFFSTKADKGCGLGLPMVRWFAERSGGVVRLTSRPGGGTTVRLLLPAQRVELGDTTVQTMPLSALPAGDETVLVLSDSLELRTTICEILSTLGYKVVADAPNAISQLLFAHPSAAAILIDTQEVSPSVAQQIRRGLERRSAKAGIVTIGDELRGIEGFMTPIRIPKPFGLTELTTAVRQAVGG